MGLLLQAFEQLLSPTAKPVQVTFQVLRLTLSRSLTNLILGGITSMIQCTLQRLDLCLLLPLVGFLL